MKLKRGENMGNEIKDRDLMDKIKMDQYVMGVLNDLIEHVDKLERDIAEMKAQIEKIEMD